MRTQLHELYAGCDHAECSHDHSTVVMAVDEQWADELARILALEVQRIWNEKGMPKKLNDQLTTYYASQLMKGVAEGYGVDLADIDYTSPDSVTIQKLTENTYQFAAAKNYTQLRQLSQALIGEDGKIRTYSQFKNAAFAINNEHVTSWLQAEYDTAIGSAQMARKWDEIQSSKSYLPLLQFDAVIDAQTSDTCRPLDNIIKPVDDPFWSVYYPPNHFRCRSSVKQLRSGKITPDHEVVHPEKGIPDMFKTNLAKSGFIFPANHPYWIGIPDDVRKQTIKLYPYDLQFEPIEEHQYKGRLRKHKLYVPSTDHHEVMQIAGEKASMGMYVDIMPNTNADVTWGKIIFYDAQNFAKSPDLRINGILAEVQKSNNSKSYRNIKTAIEEGNDQANYLIIHLSHKVDKSKLIEATKIKFRDYPHLTQIEFRNKEEYILIKNKKKSG